METQHLQFLLFFQPFLGAGDASNKLSGKIKLGSETIATIDGHWDQEVFLKDRRTGVNQLFWNPTPEIKSARLKRFTIPINAQGEFESERYNFDSHSSKYKLLNFYKDLISFEFR